MPAEAILNEIAQREGWDESTMLCLALEYIENQKDDDAWQDFLIRSATWGVGDA